ncbi:MAG TPA: hypothetical protein VI318_11555 [Baekduia sp.]
MSAGDAHPGDQPVEPFEAAAQAPDAAATAPAPDPTPEPTPTVGTADASYGAPAGSAMLGGAGHPAVDPNPEKLVGAAFAGGLVAALFLKGLARRKHR